MVIETSENAISPVQICCCIESMLPTYFIRLIIIIVIMIMIIILINIIIIMIQQTLPSYPRHAGNTTLLDPLHEELNFSP